MAEIVVVERGFDTPVTMEQVRTLFQRAAGCLDLHHARLLIPLIRPMSRVAVERRFRPCHLRHRAPPSTAPVVAQSSQPAAICFWCAVMALRMNMATVTGPTPPGTGVTQLATSFTASVSTSPTTRVVPSGSVT